MIGDSVQLQSLEEYQRAFGYSPHSLISLKTNTKSWVAPDGSGAVVYREQGNTWLAAEPMGAPADLAALVRSFGAFARERRRLVAFVPVSHRLAELSLQLDMDCVPIGMSPYFDLNEWNLSGRKRHALRAGVNQARKAGLTVEAVSGEAIPRAEVERICHDWNAERRTSTFGWVFAPDPFGFPEHKTMFLARDGAGTLVGFLTASPMPARSSSYLEDVQRIAAAPNGTTDLLIVTAMEHLRDYGVRLATLGPVPLLGVEQEDAIYRGRHDFARRMMGLVYRRGDAIYNFAGVHRFKARMSPTFWEHEYVMVPRTMLMAPRVVLAAARAIANGSIFKALLAASWKRDRA